MQSLKIPVPAEITYRGSPEELVDYLRYFARVKDCLADQMVFSCSNLCGGVNVVCTVYYEKDNDPDEGTGK